MRPTRLHWMLLSLAVVGVTGCTYAGLSYEPTLSEEEAQAAKMQGRDKRRVDVEAYIPDNFNAELTIVAEKGYQPIGYSKFTSPLVPIAAGFNARQAGQARDADLVVMAPPMPARFNQHSYLFTFWRDVDPADVFFGGYYGDADPTLLAIGGCALNRIEVQAVAAGSPADRMGLRRGDVVYGSGDAPLGWARELDDYLLSHAGAPITLRVVRDGEDVELSGVLGPAPAGAEQVREPQFDVGLRFAEATFDRDQREALGRQRGVFVDGLYFGYPACAADLVAGDLLLEIDGREVESTEEVLRALEKARKRSRIVAVRYLRRGERYETEIDLTDARADRLRGAQRRQIDEAVLAYRPWVFDEGADYSWLMASVLVAGSAAIAHQAQVEQQQQRAASYSSYQASDSSGASRSRRGGISNQNDGGAIVSTTSRGYTVRQVSRRGQTALFDPGGNRVPTRQPMPVVRFDGTFPDVDYGPSLDSIQFGHAVYGNVTTNDRIVRDLFPMR